MTSKPKTGDVVRFNHMDTPAGRVLTVDADGMLAIEGQEGLLAPHLFVVVESHSPVPWRIHRTGSHLGIKDAKGRLVIRKTVNALTIPEYDQLLSDFNFIVESVNEQS